MLQNNPLKSDIEQMNDWEAFKEHIQHSVDKQVVSNKTVIMILFLVTCCGSSAPLYSGVTGAQLTATSLTAGVTYVITYDKFTRKFFVTGV